jgi:NAD(P)-dependent dehydrogenase (short-subunit alcohol dehydrogenase family)
MSRSFVTGATGLLGRHLVPLLLARGGSVSLLARRSRSADRADRLAVFRELAEQHRAELEIVEGDVTEPGLALSPGAVDVSRLDRVFHLAALYDLGADEQRLEAVNVGGTRHLLEWLVAGGFRGVLHHVSSIAVAGDYAKRFTEEMLDAGQRHPTAYHRTKHDSERLVREEARLASRIYRPGAIVGHSKTGEMDRIDGAYYLFRAVHAVRDAAPRWVTLPGIDAARVQMVPVDFVAAAIDAIAHRPGLDGTTFHVVDPQTPRFRTTWNLVAGAAGAPSMGKPRLAAAGKWLPALGALGQLGSVRFFRALALESVGVPPVVHDAQNREVEYDTTNLEAALDGSGIVCPPQATYVEALWDYYVRHLDPKRDPVRRARETLSGKVVLVTGASSGIGESLSLYCAEVGATVVLVARREDELARVHGAIVTAGGAASYVVADLADHEACDRAVRTTIERHGRVDVLVNNAGRSIRRPLVESLDRFHDLERVMQINYFGAARMIRGVLPGMIAAGGGVIVNVLSAGARMGSPRFGAYTASKAALGQLGDTLAAEHLHDGIRVVNAYLPWVRTPMMDATGKYRDTDAMSPDAAARHIVDGIVDRSQHLVSADVRRRFVFMALRPEALTAILNVLYRIYTEDPGAHPELELDRTILKRFVKGRLM